MSPRTRAGAAAAVVLWLAGCGGTATGPPADPAPSPADPVAVPAPPESTGAFVSGAYELSGKTVSDHCRGALFFAARKMEIDLEERRLVIDLDDRTYRIAMDGDQLVARGEFQPIGRCGTNQFIEIWRLRRANDDGGLTGYLTTYWRSPQAHDCLRACKLVVEVEAQRVTGGDG